MMLSLYDSRVVLLILASLTSVKAQNIYGQWFCMDQNCKTQMATCTASPSCKALMDASYTTKATGDTAYEAVTLCYNNNFCGSATLPPVTTGGAPNVALCEATNCKDELKACVQDDTCNGLLDVPSTTTSNALFTALKQCSASKCQITATTAPAVTAVKSSSYNIGEVECVFKHCLTQYDACKKDAQCTKLLNEVKADGTPVIAPVPTWESLGQCFINNDCEGKAVVPVVGSTAGVASTAGAGSNTAAAVTGTTSGPVSTDAGEVQCMHVHCPDEVAVCESDTVCDKFLKTEEGDQNNPAIKSLINCFEKFDCLVATTGAIETTIKSGDPGKKKMSTGAAVGIAFAVLFFLGVGAAILYVFVRPGGGSAPSKPGGDIQYYAMEEPLTDEA
eukprot:m.335460 g.335460  ORF g.335460 m.335460 type:complete len:390 (+) comp17600_c0_seq1:134-1303(+)